MQSYLHAAKLRAIHAGAAWATAARARVGAAARAHHDKVLGRGEHAGTKAAAGTAAWALLRGAREGASCLQARFRHGSGTDQVEKASSQCRLEGGCIHGTCRTPAPHIPEQIFNKHSLPNGIPFSAAVGSLVRSGPGNLDLAQGRTPREG